MKTSRVSQNVKETDYVIDVEVSDLILTPLTCATLVNEILKGLLYQKSQIPYPYNWLKNIVNKKRDKDHTSIEKTGQTNLKLISHFRVVSAAYDILEKLMKGILKELSEPNETLIEVIIVFGTTPECPKEVVTINAFPIIKGHNERNHLAKLNRYQQKILRRIFLSQTWMDKMDNSLTCTNVYVFLKKVQFAQNERTVSDNNVFKTSRPLNFSSNIKQIKINLHVDQTLDSNCCDNLLVFSDEQNDKVNAVEEFLYENSNIIWYQAKDLIQGFKDCFINKTSASELW